MLDANVISYWYCYSLVPKRLSRVSQIESGFICVLLQIHKYIHTTYLNIHISSCFFFNYIITILQIHFFVNSTISGTSFSSGYPQETASLNLNGLFWRSCFATHYSLQFSQSSAASSRLRCTTERDRNTIACACYRSAFKGSSEKHVATS